MPELPDKQYFKIGEVARILEVRTSVLRFWEREFPQVKPGKSPSGQRVYSRRDLERLLEIRELLYRQGFTIAGARRRLREGGARSQEARAATDGGGGEGAPARRLLAKVKKEVEDLLRLVDE